MCDCEVYSALQLNTCMFCCAFFYYLIDDSRTHTESTRVLTRLCIVHRIGRLDPMTDIQSEHFELR